MRTLLLVLLFLNVVFFAYVRFVGGAGEAPPAIDQGVSVPRLALVGETHLAVPRCQSLGPFAEQAAAERASAWLLTGQHVSRLRSVEVAGPTDYWVVITAPTVREATSIARRLRAAGVSDLKIMPPEAGATEATVSLGLFSDRAHAQRRVTELGRSDLNPVIIEQTHAVASWWLDVDLRPREPVPDPAEVGKAAGDITGLTVVACPASGPAPGPVPGPAPEAGRGDGPAPASNAPSEPLGAAKLHGAPA
ncbi:MAG TPA: hypothetical protein VN790_10460 [Steroidobacteraceae bacterium]|nr:hypothetical protein [Steroidobacteraceae bacterium]